MLKKLLVECNQRKRPLWSSTQSTGASFDPDTLGKARTMETDHWSHATRWWINGDDLEAKDAQQDAPKTTRSRSSTSSDRFVRSHCYHQYSAQPQKQIIAYFWIFKSSTKFPSQRIKNQVNRRFLQAGMAKTLKVVHSENFWTARSAKSETGITPSFGLGLRWMTTHWKGNFINISIDLYFGICSVEYTGEIPRRRGRSNVMKTR